MHGFPAKSTGSHLLKMCKTCGKVKPLREFYKIYRNKKGRHADCRMCKLEKRRQRTVSKGISFSSEWKAKNIHAYHTAQDKHYAKKRGLSWDDYLKMCEKQEGLCAICNKPNTMKYRRRLAIDHDHKTDRVRGLLCHFCNLGLGAFKDNSELLEKAILYLWKTRLELAS